MPHCLDSGTVKEVRVSKFDGNNWESAIIDSDIPARSKLKW